MTSKNTPEPEKKGSPKKDKHTKPGAMDGHAEGGAGVPHHPDKASFLELQALIEAVPKERATTPNFSGVDAATVAIRLADAAAPHRALFAAFDAHLPGLFDAFINLPKLGRAHRYLTSQFVAAQSDEGQARVPEALIEECDEVRRRMSRVLDFVLGDISPVAVALERLRQGSGHRDRASDLEAYASLYEEHAHVLAQDKLRYDRSDVARARRLSVEISDLLDRAESGNAGEWMRLRAKATPLLIEAYERVTRAMAFIDHQAPLDEYPRFFAALRTVQGARGSKRSAEDATDADRGPTAPEAPPPAAGGSAQPPT